MVSYCSDLEAHNLSHSANLDTSHPKSLKALKGQLARDETGRQKDKADADKAKHKMNSLAEVSR
jgi:uracil DNA glycosylase